MTMMSLRGGVFAALLLTVVCAGAQPQGPAPVSSYISPPHFRLPQLSPDGHQVAMVGVRNDLEFLALIDLGTMKATVVTSLSKQHLVNYWWKECGNFLLLVQDASGKRGFYLYDAAAKKIADTPRLNDHALDVVNPLVDDPNHLVVGCYIGAELDLRLLDVRDGSLTRLEKNPGPIYDWLTNRKGEAVAAMGWESSRYFMLTRPAPGAEWRRTDLGDNDLPAFKPVATYKDQHRLLGFDITAPDRIQVALLDPASGEKTPVFSPENVEPDVIVFWGNDLTRARGVGYETDQPQFRYFDPLDAKWMSIIDQALPRLINRVVSSSKDESRLIIESYSDREAPAFYMLDRKTGKLLPLGSSYPDLPSAPTPSRYFDYVAADGTKLHGRIYLPAPGDQPPPLVVQVGPDINGPRSRFDFDTVIQLLVSRGYAVARFDYRGVLGYGDAYARAGDQQIVTGMPNDIITGILWLEQQRLVDPRRVALWGTRRGGIPALAALTQKPELFAAWVNFSTPLSRGYLSYDDAALGRSNDKERRHRMGSVIQANKYFDSINPAEMLEKVLVPTFSYYYRREDNTPAYHGDWAEDHFSKVKVPHVFLRGPMVQEFWGPIDARDGIWREENLRVYTQLMDFLDTHLKPAK